MADFRRSVTVVPPLCRSGAVEGLSGVRNSYDEPSSTFKKTVNPVFFFV
ncbi:hypothetical protein GNZ13_48455 [Paraburkholderia sp. 5N]|uniref:Uncharacterized protein n=1 Tax=Paraburkholderia elongata TaxID=2675747 RepID=A0A972SPC5_9BURK|nr:hypothetical protein [Paraburkholderia elongata]